MSRTLPKKIASALGRRGGAARTLALTPAERSDAARHAANARWQRYREALKSTDDGGLVAENGVE